MNLEATRRAIGLDVTCRCRVGDPAAFSNVALSTPSPPLRWHAVGVRTDRLGPMVRSPAPAVSPRPSGASARGGAKRYSPGRPGVPRRLVLRRRCDVEMRVCDVETFAAMLRDL